MGVATMRVPTIFTAVDRFSGVVSKMTATTAAFGRTAEASAMRTSRKFNSAGTTMLYTGAAIATGLGYAVNEAVKFEKAMATVSTTIDNTTPEMMKGMGEEVLAMSKKIPKSIDELTTGLYDVVSAGIEASGAMTVLNSSGRLAVAGLGTTQEGVDLLTSSINSFNMKATDAERIANMAFKAVKYGKTTVSQLAESFGSSSALVKNSNVTLEEYLATTAVLTTTGMTASRAQTQVSSAITALIKPSKTMQAIFDNLGVKDIPKFIKSSKGLIPALEIVKKKADEMGILTSKAFGRKEGFSAMLSLLGPLRSKYDTVLKDMIENTDTLTESFEKQQATTAAGFQRLKNNITILAIRLGDKLLPMVNKFVDKLIPLIDSTSEWIKNNKWLVTTLAKVAIGLLVLGAIAKVLAVLFYGVAKVIGIVSAVMEAYAFVSAMAALANVSFATALWGCVTALWAFLWPIGLVIAAIAILAWEVTDMVQHWEDWSKFIIYTLGPLGWTIALIMKLGDHWDRIIDAFHNNGIVAGMKEIGNAIVDWVLEPLQGVLSVLSRLPVVGNSFKGMSESISSYRTPELGAIGMQGATNFQTFGGSIPSWNLGGNQPTDSLVNKPKNLAGSKQLNSQDTLNSKNSNGGTLKVEVIAPPGYGVNLDDSQVKGIPVYTGSNSGSGVWGGPNKTK